MDELLAHHEWVSRLARQLAGAGADDVEQETWLAALRSPPDSRRSTRPWLATVVRNVVKLRWRDGTRLTRREQAYQAVGSTEVEAVDQVYERMELQRFVAEQVMALEEPLRQVVVLRYVEGLDASRIAELVNAPPGTVRWRLKTALDQLRSALDARCGGDRRTWVVVLAPGNWAPARVTTSPGPMTKGTLLMAHAKLKTTVVVAFVLLILGALGTTGTLLWRSRTGAAGPQSRSGGPIDGLVPPSTARGVLAARSSAPTTGGSLSGVVQDREGHRIDGAVVVATPAPSAAGPGPHASPLSAPAHARTNGEGAFRIVGLSPGRYLLTATTSAAGAARSAPLSLSLDQAVGGIVLTVGGAAAGLSGRVVDSGGGGIAGARVLGGFMDGNSPIAFAAITDEQGRYVLPLPRGDYRFQAEAEGYAPARFSLYLHLPMVRDFRLYPASRITGRVLARAGGAPLAGAEVSLVNLQSLERSMVTRTTFADDGGAFVFDGMDPGTYRLIAHAGPFVGQHPSAIVVGLARDAAVDILLDRGRTVRGTVHARDGTALPDVAVMIPFGPVEFLASRQPGAHARSDRDGRFELEGLPPDPGLEILAISPRGRARQPIDLTAGDREGVRLLVAMGGVVTGVVLDQRRRPVEHARVVAATGSPRGAWSGVSQSDARGRFRIDGLDEGPLTISALHESGVAEISAGLLDSDKPKEVEIILSEGATVSGIVRRQDGQLAAGVQVFAFAGTGAPSPWGQPTAATQTAADGRYRFASLPPGEVMVRAVNQGDDPFAALPSRQRRPDRAPLVLLAGDERSTVDLVVLRNDLTITGRVIDGDGRPVDGVALNALPDGAGSAVPQARTLSQSDGKFAIEGLSEGLHAIVVAHPDFPASRREQVAAGSSGIELRLERGGSLAGVVIGQGGRPATDFLIVARPTVGPKATEPELRASWSRPSFQTGVMSQPDGAFAFASATSATYEIVAYLPDRSVAILPKVELAAGERKTGLRLEAQPSSTIRGRVINYRTGQPIAGARVEGRGTATGYLVATTDASGRFSIDGFPAGHTADFAVVGPRWDYLTDCQHRMMPPQGGDAGVVDIGDVPLFPGPGQKLTIAGTAATGLWFHSREGRPLIHSVMPGSAGAAAGARNGEWVLAVDGVDVSKASSSVVEGIVATGGRTVALTVKTIESSGPPRIVYVSRVP